jgi:CRISPR/Cas system-associated endonuclease Cas1
MVLKIDEKNLKQGVLGLVLALVEIIRDVLRHQAVRRMEGGSLTEEEVERLGCALIELDEAIQQIIQEQGLREAVQSAQHGLNRLLADDLLEGLVNPRKWRRVDG